jgi:hypothetical protein
MKAVQFALIGLLLVAGCTQSSSQTKEPSVLSESDSIGSEIDKLAPELEGLDALLDSNLSDLNATDVFSEGTEFPELI